MKEDLSKYNCEGSTLRKAQLKMLEMLIEVDRICRKHSIKYWIDFGTLLGAVRHEAFIPWDDDLDICMLSEDYQKFMEVANSELTGNYFLQTKKTDPNAQIATQMLRIRDNNSLYICGTENLRRPWNSGVFIDIFKVKEAPRLPDFLLRFLGHRISYAYNFYIYNPELTFKNIVAYFIYPFSYILFKGLWNFFSLFNTNKFTVCPECYIYGDSIRGESLFPLKEIEFEQYKFYAPKDAQLRLESLYGDYMQIPSPEKRRLHAKYIFFDLDKSRINQMFH